MKEDARTRQEVMAQVSKIERKIARIELLSLSSNAACIASYLKQTSQANRDSSVVWKPESGGATEKERRQNAPHPRQAVDKGVKQVSQEPDAETYDGHHVPTNPAWEENASVFEPLKLPWSGRPYQLLFILSCLVTCFRHGALFAGR